MVCVSFSVFVLSRCVLSEHSAMPKGCSVLLMDDLEIVTISKDNMILTLLARWRALGTPSHAF